MKPCFSFLNFALFRISIPPFIHFDGTMNGNERDERRRSLAISALLNEEPFDPLPRPSSQLPTAEQKRLNRMTWPNAIMIDASSSKSYHATEAADAADSSSDAWDSKTEDGHEDGGMTKTKRKRISAEQCKRLMEVFDTTNTPSSDVREELAHELGMTSREVQVWFQNRRAKLNRTKAAHNNNGFFRSRQSLSVMPPIMTPVRPKQLDLISDRPRRASAQPIMQPSHYSSPLLPSERPSSSHRNFHPIAPMPPGPTSSAAHGFSPFASQSGWKPIAPKQQTPYFNDQPSPFASKYPPIVPNPSSIHHVIADLSIQPRHDERSPVRKRPKSVIGTLGS
ncbi:homeobox domain-containing protein [Radiomyces spectabilis]|uniref:homeobox domain-containing protein n=1 Tax=Radiomyces spectabilis TaxID=64574 RepID=UPI0022208EB3|nr:homeobox domain-containing protein [Radiomyces spectabilis]KAI8376393.1 homeobox domain-containing protein [Radiomyces spectabilis]